MEAAQLRNLVERTRKLLSCPTKWDDHFEDGLLRKELQIYWQLVCKDFEVDGESRFYQVFDIEWALNEHLLQTMEINVPVWRDKAVEEYKKRVGFLTKLSHMDRFGYPKHFPPANLLKDQIIARTSHSESLFFPEVTVQVFQWLFECVLTQEWLTIVEQRPPPVFLTSEMQVGASDGAISNTLRFDMDYSTPTIHSHPRQPNDIPEGALHLYDENYEAGCFDEDEYLNELTLSNIDDFQIE